MLMLGLVAAGIDDLISRNLIALWVPAAIAVACGLGARAARAGIAVGVVLCATGLAAVVGVAASRSLQRPDWRPVARLLGVPPAGGRVLVLQHYRDLLPLSLYLPGMREWRDTAARVADEIDAVAISAPHEPLCWWGAACNLSPSVAQHSYLVPGFHELWQRRVLQFTVTRLVATRPLPVTRRELSRALVTTTLPRDGLVYEP